MVKKFFKATSKRLTCHKKYKIERKVREHKRKIRKEEKSGMHKRKDPGIPNSLPFKEQVIEEAKKVNEHTAAYNKKRTLAGLMKDATYRGNNFNSNKTEVTKKPKNGKNNGDNSRSFYREFKKVLEDSDVVLEVLDARDPLGTRCIEMEEEAISRNKKLVLILNKIDLIPKSNVQEWLTYLRRSHPTLAFKANTQEQRDKLSRNSMKWEHASEALYKSSQSLGAEGLLSLLGNYARVRSTIPGEEKGGLNCLTIGVVGLPNTGKSALINTLKRSKVCPSSQYAGLTRHSQTIQLDKHLRLLDSPGIVLSKTADINDLVLRNCARVESLPDPVPAVESILRRCQKHQLLFRYNLADFSSTTDFLAQLATRMGKLKKGGVPDMNQSARHIIQDWIQGRITYYTQPPELPTATTNIENSTTILSKLSPEFKLVDLDTKIMKELPEKREPSSGHYPIEVVMPASAPLHMFSGVDEAEEKEVSCEEVMSEDDDDDYVTDEEEGEEADEAPAETVHVEMEQPKQKKKRFRKGTKKEESKTSLLKGLQLNKERKIMAKKKKKVTIKTNKRLSNSMTSMLKL